MGQPTKPNKPHITWKHDGVMNSYNAFNNKKEILGLLYLRRWGKHTHWTWKQGIGIDMSPGCLEEVRKKQKKLFNNRKKGT